VGATHWFLERPMGERLGLSGSLSDHVKFEWSPDGRALALTDYVASNQSVCSVVLATADIQTTDLTEIITAKYDVQEGHRRSEVQRVVAQNGIKS
jgi:hypothetical protein